MRRAWWVAAIAVAVMGASTPAALRPANTASPPKAGAVTAVSVLRASGRAEVVIGLSGDVDVQDFALSAPHRIVIDLTGATLKLPPQLYDGVVRGGITNIRVGYFKANIVRIVLDLDRDREYTLVRGDGDVRVSLGDADAFEPWNLGAAPAAPVAPATLPDTPAQASAPAGRSTTLPLRPLSFEAEPQQAGGRVTVTFRDTDLRDVLDIFSERAQRSIVTGLTNVRINASIVDQPWQTALKAILDTYGLAAVENTQSHIISVASYADLRAQMASEPLSQSRLALNYAKATELQVTLQALLSTDCGGGPLQVVGAPAAAGGDAAAGAAGGAAAGAAAPGPQPAQMTSQDCKPRGKVVAEAPTNTLVIYEAASRIDSLVSYARSFDLKPQQVNIRAKIIAINRTTTNDLGISYDLGSSSAFFNTLSPRVTPGGSQQPGEFQVTLGGEAFAGVANAGRSFKTGQAINLLYNTTIGNFSLTSFLDALTQEELSDVQAEPSVNTVDKREAKLFAGEHVSFLLTPQTAPGAIQAAAPQISALDVGITLTVTPSISANRTVRLTISAEQSAGLVFTVAGPNYSKRLHTTEVIVRDGETVVIAGLTQTQQTKTRRGIPLLMTLPMIGRLFSENSTVETKNDLLIMITPHIMDDPIPGPPGGH